MSSHNNGRANNARLKHKYVNELLKADSNSDKTVQKKEGSIKIFERFIEHQDFRIYNKTVGEKFKIELFKRKGRTNENLSLSTIDFHVNEIQNFLKWLRQEKRYKSKIILRDIDYLNLTADEKDKHRSYKKLLELPKIEDAIKQINLIPRETEIDLRDRAIFAFIMCTGVRAEALISLPIASIDSENMLVDQNPDYGVKTKFRHHIKSKILNRSDLLITEFLDWYKFLLQEKKFDEQLPLFPKTDQQKDENSALFSNKKVSKDFWLSQSSLTSMMKKRNDSRFVNYFSPHLYRHSAILYATDKCVTPGEFKAVSQNFGHRDVLTTLLTYGNLSPRDVMQKMNVIDSRDDQKLKVILRNIEKIDINSTTTSSNSFINEMINLLESHGYNVTEQ